MRFSGTPYRLVPSQKSSDSEYLASKQERGSLVHFLCLATTLLNDESLYGDVTTCRPTAVRMNKLSDWLAAGRRPTQRGRRTRIFHLLGRRLRDIVLWHAAVRSLEERTPRLLLRRYCF